MLEQTYVTVLLFTTFLLVCCTNVGCKIVEIDLSDDLPKNIMVGTFVNDKNHLKPMLDICAILIERGYNVSFFKQIRFFLFGMPKNRFFFIDPWDLGMFEFERTGCGGRMEFRGAAAGKIILFFASKF